MNRYVVTVPRKTFIAAAFVMMVLTLGASIAPAKLDSDKAAASTVAQRTSESAAATEVEIIPSRIEVVGTREPKTMFGAVRQFFARKVQAS